MKTWFHFSTTFRFHFLHNMLLANSLGIPLIIRLNFEKTHNVLLPLPVTSVCCYPPSAAEEHCSLQEHSSKEKPEDASLPNPGILKKKELYPNENTQAV